MCTIKSSFLTVVILLIVGVISSFAAPGRFEQELSGPAWRIWLDRSAQWIDDDLFLPPVNIASLPVNLPTGGWENLDKSFNRTVSVPGTVEEYFWSANGNPTGIAGDYRGVSWWSTTFRAAPALRGKRIFLAFESVNLRAEVFVNCKLAGYDVIGNTPFDVDITSAVTFESDNRLDVRITDPGGTFSWNDENLLVWGKNRIPSVHGFGGITGRIFLRAVDSVQVNDIYVQNKPDPRKAEVFVTLGNSSGAPQSGNVTLKIHEWKNPFDVLCEKTVSETIPPSGKEISLAVDAPKAKLWDIREPNLYTASVSFVSNDGRLSDSMNRRFGFRWFDTGEMDGDKRLYLNGKRVFIFAAMTRGFWPKTGMFPTPEIAKKDMETAISLGFNMMLYHRAIGQPPSIEMADETGMLAYEEPGGYLCRPGPDATAQAWRSEKLRRMVIRDRSHPSMVIFNIDDLSYAAPTEIDKQNITLAHTLDPSRIVTYNCIIAPKIPEVPDDPMKMHMKPFDQKLYYHGWTSPYHLIRWGGYLDEFYRNPRYYLRYVIDPVADMGDSLHPISKDEIIFYGEEGDMGAPLQLEKIKNELARTGATGWREGEHLKWYNSYSRFLDESGFQSSFPTVADFTLALGERMHYFHGRILENTRISNKVDVYVLNGWATEATHTDIVDVYRNPTGDPAILRYYTQPLYVAVKLREKVLPPGATPVADIYLVNEKNLKGKFNLTLDFENPSGEIAHAKTFPVVILGGEEFGQLLVEDFRMPPVSTPGYWKLKATLADEKGTVQATGFDDIFVADYSKGPGVKGRVAVIDTSGVIKSFLKQSRSVIAEDFDSNVPFYDYLIIGAHDYSRVRNLGVPKNSRPTDPIMDRVACGTTLIILDQAESWAARMAGFDYPAVKFTGSAHWGKQGHLFVGKSPFFSGLPMSRAMNWEYQAFYRGDVWGLRFDRAGVETIVGLAANQTDEVLDALSRVPFGTGQILITTLPILTELASTRHQSVVAKKLFLNMLEMSNKKSEP